MTSDPSAPFLGLAFKLEVSSTKGTLAKVLHFLSCQFLLFVGRSLWSTNVC